ncbi:interferon lambda receptor 1-like [Dryobates pubescens]|uniref:interferon lambda receptor 1-like n=1 Tax=Dryobates pubescens TaxID=118200 RepID=UPI0023B9CC94|nr:interferon lambda receptor 1-like [Dryobates pubescens]
MAPGQVCTILSQCRRRLREAGMCRWWYHRLCWWTPLPPRDVRLEAQNFHVFLWWEPDLGSPGDATYEVEWRRGAFHWTKAYACWGNSTSSSWMCELYFDKIHDIYWARVRAVARGQLSKWAYSSELQPYRDTIMGPPALSWLLQGDILSVNITPPLTPFRRKNGSYRPVDRVLWELWYQLSLHEGNVTLQQVPCKQNGKEVPCTFTLLKPSTQYCIRTVAMGMAQQRIREAEQCLVTPAGPAGFSWVLLAMLSCVFLLSMTGLCFIQLHVLLSTSEMHLPKALAVFNRDLSVPIRVPTLQLKEDSLSFLLPSVLPSHGLQTTPTAQLLPGTSLSQDLGGYCANGFRPDHHEERNLSCTFTQVGHALGSQVSLQLEKGEEAHNEDDVLEQPVPVGLTRDCSMGDRDYRTSKMWLSLHLQLYSKCQCPALGSGGCLPLPAMGRSLSQEDLQESLGMAGHCIPLSSVRLPAHEEDDSGQLIHALQHDHRTELQPGDSTVQQDNLEPAAPGTSSPCQLTQLPAARPQVSAFSGYELCVPADRTP